MKIVSNFTSFIVAILVLLVVYDASMRYFFSGGSIALQELEWHLFDIIILFGISYTLKENSHVRVDIFYANYKPKTKAVINLISALFFILPLSLFILYLGVDFVAMSFAQNEASSNPGGLEHRYLVKALLPLSFLLLAIEALLSIRKSYDIINFKN